MSVSIRPVRKDDPREAIRLAAVGQATFLETFAGVLRGGDILEHCAHQHSPEHYARWLTDPASRAWLAEAEPGGAPVGYLTVGPAALPLPTPDPSDLEIKRIYVLQRFQRGGLGRALFAAALAQARADGRRRIALGVYGGNSRAIAFYEAQGLHVVGRRQFQVGSHLYDDLVLAREITATPSSP